jgi:hypothetical protein
MPATAYKPSVKADTLRVGLLLLPKLSITALRPGNLIANAILKGA